jgi:hypothetical protein
MHIKGHIEMKELEAWTRVGTIKRWERFDKGI